MPYWKLGMTASIYVTQDRFARGRGPATRIKEEQLHRHFRALWCQGASAPLIRPLEGDGQMQGCCR